MRYGRVGEVGVDRRCILEEASNRAVYDEYNMRFIALTTFFCCFYSHAHFQGILSALTWDSAASSSRLRPHGPSTTHVPFAAKLMDLPFAVLHCRHIS